MKNIILSSLLTLAMILNGCSDANTAYTASNDQSETPKNIVPNTSTETNDDTSVNNDEPNDQPIDNSSNDSLEIPSEPTTTAEPTPTSEPKPTENYIIPVIDEATKQAYLEAINVARGNIQDCGVNGTFDATEPVKWNDALYKASYEHSYDLANSNTFSHTGSNTIYDITAQQLSLNQGSTLNQRVGYNGYTNWRAIGENIAVGYSTVQVTIDEWLKSDGHCANLMNPNFSEVGLAVVYKADSAYKYYWTQNLGKRF